MKLKNRLIFTSHVKSIKTLSEFIGYVAESTLGTIVIVVIGVVFSPPSFSSVSFCVYRMVYQRSLVCKKNGRKKSSVEELLRGQ